MQTITVIGIDHDFNFIHSTLENIPGLAPVYLGTDTIPTSVYGVYSNLANIMIEIPDGIDIDLVKTKLGFTYL